MQCNPGMAFIFSAYFANSTAFLAASSRPDIMSMLSIFFPRISFASLMFVPGGVGNAQRCTLHADYDANPSWTLLGSLNDSLSNSVTSHYPPEYIDKNDVNLWR
jgi:hypothetical protein